MILESNHSKDNKKSNIPSFEIDHSNVNEQSDQDFYGHGKLLLTGEYLVLKGARGIALPTVLGQSLNVRYEKSFHPVLNWKSFDYKGELWLEANFEFWNFDCLDEEISPEVEVLQDLLRRTRDENKHFLRDSVNVFVETNIGFPRDWGLGSSSTLIYNIAQWAYVGPFELQAKTFGGSGYDIACAQSDEPVLYNRAEGCPNWAPIEFSPSFRDKLFFVYLGRKQNSKEAIKDFNLRETPSCKIIERISEISDRVIEVEDLGEFCALMKEHEEIVGKVLGRKTVQAEFFPDFKGIVKSLGAWGGDFVLVASSEPSDYTKNYFGERGMNTIIPYSQLILSNENRRNGQFFKTVFSSRNSKNNEHIQ